ncbi:MAG: hypothetical protein ACAI25_04640 [Planctomycetota bacterium]
MSGRLRSCRSLGAALGGLLLALAGCSSNKLTIEVSSTPETNEGRPFYAVVRQVEQATYVTDGYDIIAAKVFKNPPDPSVLRSEVIYPGRTLELVVQKPETVPIAVYFLFSHPGERWKMSRVQPLPSSLSIELDKNQIKGE